MLSATNTDTKTLIFLPAEIGFNILSYLSDDDWHMLAIINKQFWHEYHFLHLQKFLQEKNKPQLQNTIIWLYLNLNLTTEVFTFTSDNTYNKWFGILKKLLASACLTPLYRAVTYVILLQYIKSQQKSSITHKEKQRLEAEFQVQLHLLETIDSEATKSIRLYYNNESIENYDGPVIYKEFSSVNYAAILLKPYLDTATDKISGKLLKKLVSSSHLEIANNLIPYLHAYLMLAKTTVKNEFLEKLISGKHDDKLLTASIPVIYKKEIVFILSQIWSQLPEEDRLSKIKNGAIHPLEISFLAICQLLKNSNKQAYSNLLDVIPFRSYPAEFITLLFSVLSNEQQKFFLLEKVFPLFNSRSEQFAVRCLQELLKANVVIEVINGVDCIVKLKNPSDSLVQIFQENVQIADDWFNKLKSAYFDLNSQNIKFENGFEMIMATLLALNSKNKYENMLDELIEKNKKNTIPNSGEFTSANVNIQDFRWMNEHPPTGAYLKLLLSLMMITDNNNSANSFDIMYKLLAMTHLNIYTTVLAHCLQSMPEKIRQEKLEMMRTTLHDILPAVTNNHMTLLHTSPLWLHFSKNIKTLLLYYRSSPDDQFFQEFIKLNFHMSTLEIHPIKMLAQDTLIALGAYVSSDAQLKLYDMIKYRKNEEMELIALTQSLDPAHIEAGIDKCWLHITRDNAFNINTDVLANLYNALPTQESKLYLLDKIFIFTKQYIEGRCLYVTDFIKEILPTQSEIMSRKIISGTIDTLTSHKSFPDIKVMILATLEPNQHPKIMAEYFDRIVEIIDTPWNRLAHKLLSATLSHLSNEQLQSLCPAIKKLFSDQNITVDNNFFLFGNTAQQASDNGQIVEFKKQM